MFHYSLYRWLSSNPPVLWHSISHEQDVSEFLPPEKILHTAMSLWYVLASEWEAYYQKWQTRFPEHEFLLLINDEEVYRQLIRGDSPALFANQNCFIDERRYTIQPEIPKAYDAVYNARMAPFKRHALLRNVPASLLIGGIVTFDDNQQYFDGVRAALPNAVFTHHPTNQVLSPEQVATHLNSARVGVCLSEVEGAMFACVEYLLCGLPVVSTHNIGGRNVWLDPEFSRMVPPDPDAIAAAVQELASLQIDPQTIRAATIARMTEHRIRFTRAVQSFFESRNVGRDFAREFYEKFNNQCGHWRLPKDVMDFVNLPMGTGR